MQVRPASYRFIVVIVYFDASFLIAKLALELVPSFLPRVWLIINYKPTTFTNKVSHFGRVCELESPRVALHVAGSKTELTEDDWVALSPCRLLAQATVTLHEP